jgi:hypothetical protein
MILICNPEDGQGLCSLLDGHIVGSVYRVCAIWVESYGMEIHGVVPVYNDCVNVGHLLQELKEFGCEFQYSNVEVVELLAGLGNARDYVRSLRNRC